MKNKKLAYVPSRQFEENISNFGQDGNKKLQLLQDEINKKIAVFEEENNCQIFSSNQEKGIKLYILKYL